jgi:hypothetical protein
MTSKWIKTKRTFTRLLISTLQGNKRTGQVTATFRIWLYNARQPIIKTNNKLLTVNYLDNVNETANIQRFFIMLASREQYI